MREFLTLNAYRKFETRPSHCPVCLLCRQVVWTSTRSPIDGDLGLSRSRMGLDGRLMVRKRHLHNYGTLFLPYLFYYVEFGNMSSLTGEQVMGTIRVRIASDEASAAESASTEQRETKELWGGNRGGSRVVPFDTAELAESLRALTSQLGDLFSGIREVADFNLQQVQVGLEISAEGGFELIGSARAGAKGAITLSFAPRASEDS